MDTYRIIGGNGSPYSQKLRAIFRYRRIPHVWVLRTKALLEQLTDVRPMLVPILEYPDGTRRTDSTPLALDMEGRFPNDRLLQPDDPALAFLSCLIEDMADEWLVKCMFHYRFAYPEGRTYGPRWVIYDSRPDLTDPAEFEAASAAFLARQSGRMPMVGCTPANAPVIEETYRRVLAILEENVVRDGYLFGSRPSLADFGLFGQLKTLGTDPSSLTIMRAEAPLTEHWVRSLEDASGVEGAWRGLDDLSPAVEALLRLIGEAYLPFLQANAQAAEAGEENLSLEIWGKPYAQGMFRYQAKCLRWLQSAFRDLPLESQTDLKPLLAETGCLDALTRAG